MNFAKFFSCSAILLCVVSILLFQGCSSKNLRSSVQQLPLNSEPSFLADAHLNFRPPRLWRLVVKSSPDLKNDRHSVLKKQFQFIAVNEIEKKKLREQIQTFGGDDAFVLWLENRIQPLGGVDELSKRIIYEMKGRLIVDLVFTSTVSTPRLGMLKLQHFAVPDPLWDQVLRQCYEGLNPLLVPGDGFGVEVVLESRNSDPEGIRWDYREANFDFGVIKTWSVGAGQAISYRALVEIRKSVSSCPSPPQLAQAFEELSIKFEKDIGIQW